MELAVAEKYMLAMKNNVSKIAADQFFEQCVREKQQLLAILWLLSASITSSVTMLPLLFTTNGESFSLLAA